MIHHLLGLAAGDQQTRGLVTTGPAKINNLRVKLYRLPADAFQGVEPRLLPRIVSCERSELLQRLGDLHLCAGKRLEKSRVSSKHVPSSARLCVLERGEQLFSLDQDGVGV
jgi:hypothetical protein